MNLLNFKEFPDETKTSEFVFENGVANNRLRTHFNSNNSLYLLYEHFGNPNYIDNPDENALVNLIDLEAVFKQQQNQNSCLDSIKEKDSIIYRLLRKIRNALPNIFSLKSSQNKTSNVDDLAKSSLGSDKILMIKVSRLSRYCLLQFESKDLCFINLTAKSYIKLKLGSSDKNEEQNRVVYFDFHPIYDNQILICKKNVLGIMEYSREKSHLFVNHVNIAEFKDVVLAKYFRNGEYIPNKIETLLFFIMVEE